MDEGDPGPVTRSYFILNELQILRLCVLAVAGRRPVVLHVWPLLGINRRWLQKISAYLEKRGLIADPFLLHPAWQRFIERQGGVSAYGFYTNVYKKLEPAQEKLFKLQALSKRLPVFAQAVRHRIATHYTDLHWFILAMRDLGPEDCVYGLPPEIARYASVYCDGVEACTVCTPLRLRPLLNTSIWLLATAFTCAWIIRRTVIYSPTKRKYQLGADLLQVLRHLYVTREMVDDDSQCLIVFRTSEFQEMYKDRIGDIDHCLVTDGCVPLKHLPSFLATALVGHARLFLCSLRYEPALYRRVATLAQWQIVFRALLQRFDLERFLARDDYNGEHSVRSAELRRAGVMSIGIGHGLPTSNLISPVFRFLDFDYYLTFSRDFFEKYYRESFTPETVIVGIGSIGLTREGFEKLPNPRPKDIVVFMSHDIQAERYVTEVQEIARRFPHKRFLCKIKESQFVHGTAEFFLDAISGGPENMIETRQDSYELMLEGQYAISNDSTVIAEAIGYGQYCFMYDVYLEVAPDDGHSSMYRAYPEICVNSADAFERCIRGIEMGQWEYPREKLSGLIDLSGINPFDRIRTTIGLAPKAPLKPIKLSAA